MTYLGVVEAGKMIRQVLKKEAPKLHVRHDRGTAYGWIEIRGSMDCGYFTLQEWDVLVKYGLLQGEYGDGKRTNDATISPEDREFYVTKITGKPLVKLCEKCDKYVAVEGKNYCQACQGYFDGLLQAAENERREKEENRAKLEDYYKHDVAGVYAKKKPVQLPHTDQITQLIKEGPVGIAAAMVKHNEHVNDQMKRAKAGETINLSDLMAAKEQIDLALNDLQNVRRERMARYVT